MGKLYRTAQGKEVDMEKLRLQNELVPALGNMKVNARGDQLGPGGKILKRREQIVDEVYRGRLDNTTRPAKDGPIPTRSARPTADPIPTSTKQLDKEFTPGSAAIDVVETLPKPKAKRATKSEGGLAKASAKTKE